MDKLFHGRWSQKHGVIQPGKEIPEDFGYFCRVFQRELISVDQARDCIEFFESENREWLPTLGQIVSRCKHKLGVAKASHRELGKDFEVAQWLGDRRVAKETVAMDLAKIRQKLGVFS